jgi:carbamoylphosphate synthase large subunit
MKDAILILAGEGTQLPFVTSLKSLGVTLVLVGSDAVTRCRPPADYVIHESVKETGAILAKLHALPPDLRYAAVWTQSSGLATVTQTVLARELGVAHFSTHLARLALDKEAFGEFLYDHRFAVPRPLRGFHDATRLPYPVIVRPSVTTVGKQMVFQVTDAGGLASAMERALRVSGNHTAHVSQYVPGDDVTRIGV